MSNNRQILIETPQEEIHKLIKWYGWITIMVLCITPLVFILLPILVMNTGKIGNMIKGSRIPEEEGIAGTVQQAHWEADNEAGVHYVKGQLTILTQSSTMVECSFLKYVGPAQRLLPDIKEGDNVEMTGQFRTAENIDEADNNAAELQDKNIFAIRNVRKLQDGAVYTSEPTLRVY